MLNTTVRFVPEQNFTEIGESDKIVNEVRTSYYLSHGEWAELKPGGSSKNLILTNPVQ